MDDFQTASLATNLVLARAKLARVKRVIAEMKHLHSRFSNALQPDEYCLKCKLENALSDCIAAPEEEESTQ